MLDWFKYKTDPQLNVYIQDIHSKVTAEFLLKKKKRRKRKARCLLNSIEPFWILGPHLGQDSCLIGALYILASWVKPLFPPCAYPSWKVDKRYKMARPNSLRYQLASNFFLTPLPLKQKNGFHSYFLFQFYGMPPRRTTYFVGSNLGSLRKFSISRLLCYFQLAWSDYVYFKKIFT